MELIKILYDKKEVIEAESLTYGHMNIYVVIYVKDEIIMGTYDGVGKTIFDDDGRVLKSYPAGVWYGEENHGIFLLFSELLESIAFLLSKGDEKYLMDEKDIMLSTIKRYDFNVKNVNLAIHCNLGGMYTEYIFELDDEKDELIIHYGHAVLEKSGEVRVPFKPFIKEVFNKYIDEFLEIHKMYGSKKSYQILINLINDIKRLYKERYGEELEFKIPE